MRVYWQRHTGTRKILVLERDGDGVHRWGGREELQLRCVVEPVRCRCEPRPVSYAPHVEFGRAPRGEHARPAMLLPEQQ